MQIRTQHGPDTSRDLDMDARRHGFLRRRKPAQDGCSLYQTLFDEVPIGLYITTDDGRIVDANVELARMLGYADKNALVGASVIEIYANAQDRRMVMEALQQPGAVCRTEVRLRARSGAEIVAQDTCRAVRDPSTGALYYQGSLQDITEEKRVADQLRQMARHDPLTGVFNRHALAEILVSEASRSRRYGHSIGMLMIDVDRLKEFNDRFGHATGDALLRDVAGLITRCVRDSDVVVRYGGDEFLVLLVETSAQVTRVKERIECEMIAEFGDGHYGATVTLSIGAAHWSPESGESISSLLSRADRAMYADKEAKRPAPKS